MREIGLSGSSVANQAAEDAGERGQAGAREEALSAGPPLLQRQAAAGGRRGEDGRHLSLKL